MIVLNVPYAEKDEAKALGARWNPKKKSWYVPDGQSAEAFARWLPKAGAPAAEAGPARVDSHIGKTVVGKHYVPIEHDCNPFEPCALCAPVLADSGWSAARASLLEAIAGFGRGKR